MGVARYVVLFVVVLAAYVFAQEPQGEKDLAAAVSKVLGEHRKSLKTALDAYAENQVVHSAKSELDGARQKHLNALRLAEIRFSTEAASLSDEWIDRLRRDFMRCRDYEERKSLEQAIDQLTEERDESLAVIENLESVPVENLEMPRLLESLCALEESRKSALAKCVSGGAYVSNVLSDKPVGYWRLEEASGVALDSSAIAGQQNGTYSSGVSAMTGAIGSELRNSAADFTKTGAIIDVPDPAAVLGMALTSNSWTIEFWMYRVGTASSHQDPVTKGDYPVPGATFFNREPTRLTFGINNGNGGLASASLPPLNRWTYVVGTLVAEGANTRARLSVNGVLVSNVLIRGQPNPATATKPLVIGGLRQRDGYMNHFSGGVDEVAVYNFALGQDRIKAHFDAASTKREPQGKKDPSSAVSKLLEGYRRKLRKAQNGYAENKSVQSTNSELDSARREYVTALNSAEIGFSKEALSLSKKWINRLERDFRQCKHYEQGKVLEQAISELKEQQKTLLVAIEEAQRIHPKDMEAAHVLEKLTALEELRRRRIEAGAGG